MIWVRITETPSGCSWAPVLTPQTLLDWSDVGAPGWGQWVGPAWLVRVLIGGGSGLASWMEWVEEDISR